MIILSSGEIGMGLWWKTTGLGRILVAGTHVTKRFHPPSLLTGSVCPGTSVIAPRPLCRESGRISYTEANDRPELTGKHSVTDVLRSIVIRKGL